MDAVPICLGTKDPDEIVRTVKLLEPSFGGINLEDIAMPKCFRVLEEARRTCTIPVWHDDQQGTATVLLAALLNALKVVGKSIGAIRIAMIGMGAANVPTNRFLKAKGADPASIVACDLGGILGAHRTDYRDNPDYAEQWRVCQDTNGEKRQGGIPEALRGADVCIAFSAGGIIRPEWITTMAKDAIVFACANPVPEVWPWEAKEAGARIVATGRSDFPNQVNNSLVFPGIFRGALDVRDMAALADLSSRASDTLVARGERAANAVVAAALHAAGRRAERVDAAEIVATDGPHGAAAPDLAATRKNARRLLLPLLKRGVTPVVPGFLGAGPEGSVTTLGRGGSDLTATSSPGRSAPRAWCCGRTDVAGILTADPRAVPLARLQPQIHHREAAEVAYFGAKVHHPRALNPLDGSGIG